MTKDGANGRTTRLSSGDSGDNNPAVADAIAAIDVNVTGGGVHEMDSRISLRLTRATARPEADPPEIWHTVFWSVSLPPYLGCQDFWRNTAALRQRAWGVSYLHPRNNPVHRAHPAYANIPDKR